MTQASPSPELDAAAVDTAERHLADILELAIEHSSERRAMLVWDADCELARVLTEAYRRCLPEATTIEFERTEPSAVLAAFEELGAGDLVVLVQTTSFRLASFRIRLELFRRGLAVVEHPHLGRMPGAEARTYIDALAYDPGYYRGVGRALKARIDRARIGVVVSGGERLVFGAGFEPAKLNVGDYRELKSVGGQYPIGEVFSESLDLEAVAGRVRIGFFGDTNFRVNRPEQPITLVVEAGRVVDVIDTTPAFEEVLASIRAEEGQVWVRELGFGMNRALTPERVVGDIGTFERMCGVHLSLGAKHASYNKPNIRKKAARFHVDVFAVTEAVLLDDELVFSDGAWQVEPEPTPSS